MVVVLGVKIERLCSYIYIVTALRADCLMIDIINSHLNVIVCGIIELRNTIRLDASLTDYLTEFKESCVTSVAQQNNLIQHFQRSLFAKQMTKPIENVN